MENTGTCTTIALYDLEKTQVDLRGLFSFCEHWVLDQGYTPLRGSVHGEGIKATKTKTFKHVKKVVFEKAPQSLNYFWFGAYPPEWGYDMTDAVLSVSLDTDDRGYFTLYFHNDIIPFNKEHIESLIKDISKYLKSYYGIVYQRDFDKGPGLYAMGMITGLDRNSPLPEIQKERDNIGEWWRTYFFENGGYVLGHLRDIYPMNLLSDAHLSQPIFGTTLKEWVSSSPHHGELKPLTEILWEWWVPEEKIDSVREALRPTGLLICV